MIPLVAANGVEPDYLTLDEALARGNVRVTETSEAGDVPELRLENLGEQPVLLLDGEELVGAKQNRVLNLTILAPAKSTITIPVSCVEAGRWSHTSPEFSTKGRAFYAAGRARKADQVTASLRTSGTRHSRQGEVWEDIAAKSRRMESYSDTAAMECLYEDYQDQVEEYLKAIEVVEGQAGAVFAINGQIRGMELFDFSVTFRKLMPKLLRSYALDAIDEQDGSANSSPPDVMRFLSAVAAADGSEHPAVGVGDDIRCQPWRAKRRLVDPSSREAALFSRRALRQRENKVGIRKVASSHLRECGVASAEFTKVWRSGTDAGRPGQ